MPTTNRRILCAAVTTAAFLVPAAAHAAVNHTGELKAFGDKYTWADNRNVNSGGVDSGVGVFGTNPFDMCADPGFPCDDTLLHVTTAEPAQLDLTVTATGLYRPDIDIYLYSSDKNGTLGDQVGISETPESSESISAIVEPGYYLLRGAYWSGLQDNSTGSATISVPPPPEDPCDIDPDACGEEE